MLFTFKIELPLSPSINHGILQFGFSHFNIKDRLYIYIQKRDKILMQNIFVH